MQRETSSPYEVVASQLAFRSRSGLAWTIVPQQIGDKMSLQPLYGRSGYG